MAFTFSFIGAGNMGGALAKAVCQAVEPKRVLLYDRSADKAGLLAEQLGCRHGSLDQALLADIIFLGVKPQVLPGLLRGLDIPKTSLLVSMAAGITLETLNALAPGRAILRIMPNTPVGVGAGVVLWCANALVQPAQQEALLAALRHAGVVEQIPEHLMDAGSALIGCSPAFTDLYMEALADGAVACGIPRPAANRLAAAAVLGAAKLALDSGLHPGVLKDMVCSPAGSTIQGVRTLEAAGFRSAAFEAVIAATEKNKALGK